MTLKQWQWSLFSLNSSMCKIDHISQLWKGSKSYSRFLNYSGVHNFWSRKKCEGGNHVKAYARFWSTDVLAEIFDHVTQNASKSRFWSTFKLFKDAILIHSNNKRWTKIAYSNHVIDKLLEYSILVFILLFEWTKIAYSKSLKVDQNRDFEPFWVTWSKISARKSVETSRPIGRKNDFKWIQLVL